MIDILIPFLIGSVFGAIVGIFIAALMRANDENMPTE
jgi:gas vesicle protein